DWLAENVPINNTVFVEFGVEDYREANTRFLLQNRNWRGLILDSNPAHVRAVEREDLCWRYDLRPVAAIVTPENINELLAENGIIGDIGLLSIDIDGNDYWVLEAITAVSARILVCAYNAVWGDIHAITVPYLPNFDRLKAHPSGQYFGASIQALKGLAKRKGYEFIGSSSNGVNSFFVRSDLFQSVANKIKSHRAFPSRHRDSRDDAGRLTYVRGVKRADLVKHLPVTLVEEHNRRVPLASLYPLYSESWLEQIC
ncbi:MAG TPA: hypothetical protein VK463_00340, partial [Desulfomonilaceae bacterium]|nr:hypothetical protein [Desulfomonilaceae bacterium]